MTTDQDLTMYADLILKIAAAEKENEFGEVDWDTFEIFGTPVFVLMVQLLNKKGYQVMHIPHERKSKVLFGRLLLPNGTIVLRECDGPGATGVDYMDEADDLDNDSPGGEPRTSPNMETCKGE